MPASAKTPAPADPKTVRFQLITPDSPHTTARLPMRVQIYPHDATDSIVTTVKNFYGLYSSPTSSKGVSFEDEAGNTMIARYENFRDNMVVYVRVIEEPALSPSAFASRNYRSPPGAFDPAAHDPSCSPDGRDSDGPHNGSTGAGSHYAGHHQFFPSHLHDPHGEHITRPSSRTSRRRSLSPGAGRGRRSVSASTNSKNRSRSSKNRGASQQSVDAVTGYGPDSMAGYSSGDGAPGSSNGRMKEQQPIGNTEISVENIVEGGRRKRAKFESSELPLFAPPQMPAATSNPSVSPARRSDHRASLSYVLPGQNPFNGAGALQSPQHYNTHFGQSGVYATPGSDGRRTRTGNGFAVTGLGLNMGVLPTPDPTVSSLSEEDKDVAMQLMRLGEMSNMSYGRTSTSTQDDTFSGRADAASSTGATSDSESESAEDYEDDDDAAPPHRKQRLDLHGTSRKIYQSVEPADEDAADAKREAPTPVTVTSVMAAPKPKKMTKPAAAGTKAPRAHPPAAAKPRAKATKVKVNGNSSAAGSAQHTAFAGAAPSTNGTAKAAKKAAAGSVPASPASLPPSHKHSGSLTGAVGPAAAAAAIAAVAGIPEEDITDLSSKPRCQRCRKSKKGCDRQRPCGRCRDAGIPAELCISEDEGNGRKGRYGRHMGVPIKKESALSAVSMQPPPPPQHQHHSLQQLQHPQHPHQHPATVQHQHPAPPQHHHQHPVPLPPQHHHQVPQPPTQAAHAQTAIPSPSYQAPAIMPLLQNQLPPQPPKAAPSLLPPAHISSTPIMPPTIPEMMMASADKNKKRKR